MNLGDFFGPSPSNTRPDTPDFWRLAEIIQGFDIAMDNAAPAERDEVFEGLLTAHVDLPSLTYMAFQRVIRLLGIRTSTELAERQVEVGRQVALYLEAFAVGSQFQQQGGPR